MARVRANTEIPSPTAASAQNLPSVHGECGQRQGALGTGLLRPIDRQARSVAAAPAVAARPLEAGKRPLDERQLEAARLAFGLHDAEVLEPAVDRETDRPRIAAL